MNPGRLLLLIGATLGALYAAGLFYEMDVAPAGCCGLAWPTPDPVAAERRANASDPQAANPTIQRGAALEVLAARPAEPTAWLRLAYADRLAHGQLTKVGAQAMDMSYLTAIYAYRQAPWRIAFALDNWSRLTPEGRTSAIREIGIARNTPVWKDVVEAVRHGPADPAGRIAALLMGLFQGDLKLPLTQSKQ